MKTRYSKHYRIRADELAWLGARVEELGRVVRSLCSERITELKTLPPPHSDRRSGVGAVVLAERIGDHRRQRFFRARLCRRILCSQIIAQPLRRTRDHD